MESHNVKKLTRGIPDVLSGLLLHDGEAADDLSRSMIAVISL